MKKLQKMAALFLVMALVFGVIGCGDGGGDGEDGDINWDNEANGTLTVINSTNKDMVIFQGQTPSASNILGGVKALGTKTFDIEDDVDDFGVGGYIILRGITNDDYEANKSNLGKAKIEFSAMATYGQGKKFRTEISPNYTGDYGFRVNNRGQIGMELRKNSPDGEKIGYLPKLAVNQMIYSDSSNAFTIFPCYVYYTKSTGKITTVEATSHFESVLATPRPLSASTMQTYYFPQDAEITWASIVSSLSSPVAYITVVNNFSQGAFFTIGGGNALSAQNGYDAVGTGEQLTFEMVSTTAGSEKNLVLTLFGGTIQVPVRFSGETEQPSIRNGYDYTVTLNFKGGSTSVLANYEAVIVENAKRDISSDIASL